MLKIWELAAHVVELLARVAGLTTDTDDLKARVKRLEKKVGA